MFILQTMRYIQEPSAPQVCRGCTDAVFRC